MPYSSLPFTRAAGCLIVFGILLAGGLAAKEKAPLHKLVETDAERTLQLASGWVLRVVESKVPSTGAGDSESTKVSLQVTREKRTVELKHWIWPRADKQESCETIMGYFTAVDLTLKYPVIAVGVSCSSGEDVVTSHDGIALLLIVDDAANPKAFELWAGEASNVHNQVNERRKTVRPEFSAVKGGAVSVTVASIDCKALPDGQLFDPNEKPFATGRCKRTESASTSIKVSLKH